MSRKIFKVNDVTFLTKKWFSMKMNFMKCVESNISKIIWVKMIVLIQEKWLWINCEEFVLVEMSAETIKIEVMKSVNKDDDYITEKTTADMSW